MAKTRCVALGCGNRSQHSYASSTGIKTRRLCRLTIASDKHRSQCVATADMTSKEPCSRTAANVARSVSRWRVGANHSNPTLHLEVYWKVNVSARAVIAQLFHKRCWCSVTLDCESQITLSFRVSSTDTVHSLTHSTPKRSIP